MRPARPGKGRPRLLPPAGPLRIQTLGAEGDGLARDSDGRLWAIGNALTGEVVQAEPLAWQGETIQARALGWKNRSPDRQTPPCAHFGRCGGCVTQHLQDPARVAWHADSLRVLLAQAGLGQIPVLPGVMVPPGRRRRTRLGLSQRVMGYRPRAGHALVPIRHCPVLLPALEQAVLALPQHLTDLDLWRLQVTEAEWQHLPSADGQARGDLVLTCARAPDLAGLEALARLVAALDLGRLSLRRPQAGEAEVALAPAPPVLPAGPARIQVPPGAFLQATAEGEAALAAAVEAAVADLPTGRPVLDLYCGLGRLTAGLVGSRPVQGYDRDGPSIRALAEGIRRAGVARVTCVERDLDEAPLPAADLAAAGLVVIDPPRAGALAQMRVLAAWPSRLPRPRLLLVSCNPRTLLRDLALVVGQGWRVVEGLSWLDQFTWSPHREAWIRLDPE